MFAIPPLVWRRMAIHDIGGNGLTPVLDRLGAAMRTNSKDGSVGFEILMPVRCVRTAMLGSGEITPALRRLNGERVSRAGSVSLCEGIS